MPARSGERHHKAKLTEDDVREIRERRARGESIMSIWESTFAALGIQSPATIDLAGRGITWRNVK